MQEIPVLERRGGGGVVVKNILWSVLQVLQK